jgi:transcriptional regulator with XRE-family HTH domain
MSTFQKALTIRTKKLGILITDARIAARRSMKDCANVLGLSQQEFSLIELGEKTPSLPQLEVLAFYLDIPIEHFWGNKTISEDQDFKLNSKDLIKLREKVIGITIRQLRTQANIKITELATHLEISASDLKAYELGDKPIPFPLLDAMLNALNSSISSVTDQHGQLGQWYLKQKVEKRFSGLTGDIQEFMVKPVNEPYIALAKKLSELPANKLRSIAEGLLEITY